jgi:hypothetical protein
VCRNVAGRESRGIPLVARESIPGPFTDVEVKAWVGAKAVDCYGSVSGTGCATVHIVRTPEAPQLAVAWKNPPKRDNGLSITLDAHDIPGQRAALRVVDAQRHKTILNAHWAPDANGGLAQSITVAVPRASTLLCVVASTTDVAPGCPPRTSDGTAWLQLIPPDH